MITKFIEPTRKTGEESFRVGKKSLDVNLLNFWQWANSDLLNNVDRGKLAEFIVATSLGISNNISATWDSYDLEYMGKGIEIKSSAYLQSGIKKKNQLYLLE